MQRPTIVQRCVHQCFSASAKFGTKLMLLSSLCFITFLGSPVWANDFGAEMESQGQVELLRFGELQLQVGGRTYDVNPAVQVEIGGTYGAFTLLQPGMNVYLRFVQYADGRREVLEIRELSAGSRLEES